MDVLERASAVVVQATLFGLALLPLERARPAHAQPLFRRGLAVDALYFALNPFLVAPLTALLLAWVARLSGELAPAGIRSGFAALPFVAQFALILAWAEFSGYGAHRAAHRWPLLWRFHAVHHSSESLGWMSAHRQHPLEAAWLAALANVPVVALGFDLEPVLGFVLFQKFHTALVHANVATDLGPLGRFIAGPRFHHRHHAALEEGVEANFASLFPWLDRLFGTFDPAPAFPSRYGVDVPVPESFPLQLAAPFAPPASPASDSSAA